MLYEVITWRVWRGDVLMLAGHRQIDGEDAAPAGFGSDPQGAPEAVDDDEIRITSYNVCYTKLLRIKMSIDDIRAHGMPDDAIDGQRLAAAQGSCRTKEPTGCAPQPDFRLCSYNFV